MSTKYPGGFITKSPTAPTTAAAKGIWTLNQVAEYTKQGIWPATPGAPTIGTATQTGPSTATVAFTAPTNLGAGAVTFTATSSPSGITATGTSPITVSGLTTGTAYTFTVTASTPGGTGPASAASNSVTPALPAIGAAFGGGFFAGQISTAGNSVADYNIVIGSASTAEFIGQWKTSTTNTAGTTSTIDGPANTAAMIAAGAAAHPCGQFCDNLVTGGFSDWYMPARYELEICYFNLKPTTNNNSTSSGQNPNAVPARASNYTTGNPAQTSVATFQTGGAQAFFAGSYWASNENSITFGATQSFGDGFYGGDLKTSSTYSRVRAIRRVPV
jgi:hypothetical protein